MCRVFKSILWLTFTSFTLYLPSGKALADSTTTLLRKFEILQIKNQQKLQATNLIIKKLSQQIQPTKTKPMSLLRYIERRREYLLRRDFISRVLVQIDSHFDNQNQMMFLTEHLELIAQHEAKSQSPNLQLLNFILSCKEVLVNSSPDNSGPVELIDRFMNFTTIYDLKTSALFIQEQDYSNGTETFKANSLTTEKIGLVVEERIKAYERLKIQSQQNTGNTEKNINIPSRLSEYKIIERRIRLEKNLKNKNIDFKKAEKPLTKVREIKPTDKAPIMNINQFNEIFKSQK